MTETASKTTDPAAPVIVWLRQDLRLQDNPALFHADQLSKPVLPVFIADDASFDRPLGAASKWWLHHSLIALAETFETIGLPLIIRAGDSKVVLETMIRETGADTIFWNRRYANQEIQFDTAIKSDLKAKGLQVESFNSHLLNEPWTVKSKSGGSFKVFTPFWRAVIQDHPVRELYPRADLKPIDRSVISLSVDDLNLRPTDPDWAYGFHETWQPGEKGAHAKLNRFMETGLSDYQDNRNDPGIEGTSRLSPHLRFGEISPVQIWHAVMDRPRSKGSETFLSEVGWREFAYSLLFQNPAIAQDNIQVKFNAFPWRDDSHQLRAWQKGQTGFPIVDAGMRQLWQTGWMHNRVRMIVGSFLVKHLLIHWRRGEEWFWDTLLDADPASNTASWQWIAGTGADAAPYFRIFNPILQGERFDPEGDYVRTFVPEISALPKAFIHKPWDAKPEILEHFGVTLGKTYPRPIVDHSFGRDRALEAYQSLKKAS